MQPNSLAVSKTDGLELTESECRALGTLVQNWQDFASLVQLERQPLKYQVAMFRQSIGDEGREPLKFFKLSDDDTTDRKNIIDAS